MLTSTLGLTVISSIGFMGGGLLLKRYAESGLLVDLGYSLTVYFLSNLVFARVLAHGLGQGMAISSMLQLTFMAIAGAIFWDERLGQHQMAGITLAMITVWLFAQAPHAQS